MFASGSAVRRTLAAVVAGAAVFTLAQGGNASAQLALKEGVNYTVVKPAQPTSAPAGKVEVIEFFGYWCPHCHEFEPTMRDWAKRNEARVQMTFVPIPTAFRTGDNNFQKLYYTLEALGREKELRSRVFAGIHDDKSLPFTGDLGAITAWAEKNGIDKQKFIDTFNSFSVQSKVARANQLAAAYGVTGVPELGVGGKYLVTVDARTIANADVMVTRALAEK